MRELPAFRLRSPRRTVPDVFIRKFKFRSRLGNKFGIPVPIKTGGPRSNRPTGLSIGKSHLKSFRPSVTFAQAQRAALGQPKAKRPTGASPWVKKFVGIVKALKGRAMSI